MATRLSTQVNDAGNPGYLGIASLLTLLNVTSPILPSLVTFVAAPPKSADLRAPYRRGPSGRPSRRAACVHWVRPG